MLHFYHYRVCTSNYKTNPESPEHIAGKHFIGENFLPKLNDYAIFKPQYEVPVKDVMRVADILLDFNMGWRIAHEVQLSPISVEELTQRTDDYLRAGIDVLWWFGKSAETRTNREWAFDRYGFSLSLAFDDEGGVSCGYWRKIPKKDDFGRLIEVEAYRADTDLRPKEDPPVFSRVAYWWLEHSFFRYYQTWQKGSNDLYCRAFGASKRTLASFNGKTGAGNTKWFRKNFEGVWVPELPLFLEREEKNGKMKRLSDDVVDKIRARARANRSQ